MMQKYPSDTSAWRHSQEVIDWLRDNRPRITAFLKQVCSELKLPETSIPLLYGYYFLHDSGLPSPEVAPYDSAVRVDLEGHSRIYGGVTWLPDGIPAPNLDFVAEGNLETFSSNSRAEFGAGQVWGILAGRPLGTTKQVVDGRAKEEKWDSSS